MPAKVTSSAAPARKRVGLPIVPDGSRRRPLLLRLPPDGGEPAGACNNGCSDCLTKPVAGHASAWHTDVRDRQVVIRHREPTLRPDLAARVAELRARGAAGIALLTNGRLLLYPAAVAQLVRAGVDRFVIKLFGLGAAAHDAHTRVEGSFEQASAGIASARAAGVEVNVTFPLGGDPAETQALARSLTGRDPVVMPEPEVETHPDEYRFDVIALRAGVTDPLWTRTYFPMAHVNTGPVCNIRCVYCNVHGGDDQRMYSREHVERLIDAAAARVARDPGAAPSIDFIGGEPTLHPDLPALIARARQAGFARVSVCTNGLLLLRPGYLDRLVEAGLTLVRFSFHDHRPEAANRLADVEGLGTRYLDVARLLLGRTDVQTLFYRILLAETLGSLADYVRFLAEHNRTGRPIDLTLGMPSLRGRMHLNRELYPPLSGLRERVAEAVALARSLGFDPLLHHAPACLAPDEPALSACLHIEPVQYDAVSPRAEPLMLEGEARHGGACLRCDARTRGCTGLPAAYFDADPAAAEAWLTPLAL